MELKGRHAAESGEQREQEAMVGGNYGNLASADKRLISGQTV